MSEVRVTEIKRIKIDAECKDNPVYLKWLNTSGSWSFWLFSSNYTGTITTEANGEYSKANEDLETSQGSDEYISKNSTPGIVCGATVDTADMDGLKGLINSPKVDMLMNNDTWETDGAIWQRVKVRVGSFIVLRVKESKQDIEIVINQPQTNIQAE